MTPPRPAMPTDFTPSANFHGGVFFLLGVIALATFGWKISASSFVDEYAYISQSYYADLLLDGKTNDRAWLEPPAYDLVPLPKYVIGGALRLAGEPRPGPTAARLWYEDTHSQFGTQRTLAISRIPSIILGAIGCVALAMLGALAFNLRVGVVAGFLFMLNPLYALHAHRAMSEAPCEAFLLIALALFLAGWKFTWGNPGGWKTILVFSAAAGAATALSVLAKFNGLIVVMTIPVWAVLTWNPQRPGRLDRRVVAGVGVAVLFAAIGFLALNPYMTARPNPPLSAEAESIADLGLWNRFSLLIQHRRVMSAGQQEIFPHNALTTIDERAKVVAAQGFGRFGIFGPPKSDSTIRYDVKQDWGAYLWLPLCLAGLGYSLVIGRSQRQANLAPTAWAAAVWALISLFVVTLYIPMAWDRYLLPIQAPFSLMAAAILVRIVDAAVRLARPQTQVKRESA